MTDDFWWFLNERHRIYCKRQAGEPGPWTDDPVLQAYRFCNVFRELDTTTIWIRENIREPYADHPDLWLMLCLARQINHPPALAEVFAEDWTDYEFDLEYCAEVLVARHATKAKCYSAAYMITGANCPAGWPKVKHTCLNVVRPLQVATTPEQRAVMRTQITNATMMLAGWAGWGLFLAYEVATDLRHCPGWLAEAKDINTWTNIGPGARRGINRVHGRDLLHFTPPIPDGILELTTLLDEAPFYLEDHVPDLELRDIEHTLCEYDKWVRGGGKEKFKCSY